MLWTTEFHLRTLTARAWGSIATISDALVVSGGFSGSEVRSIWALRPGRLLDMEERALQAVVDPITATVRTVATTRNQLINGLPLLFWHRLDRSPASGVFPSPRFGHVAVGIDDNTMYFGAGRSGQEGRCFSDGWLFSLCDLRLCAFACVWGGEERECVCHARGVRRVCGSNCVRTRPRTRLD